MFVKYLFCKESSSYTWVKYFVFFFQVQVYMDLIGIRGIFILYIYIYRFIYGLGYFYVFGFDVGLLGSEMIIVFIIFMVFLIFFQFFGRRLEIGQRWVWLGEVSVYFNFGFVQISFFFVFCLLVLVINKDLCLRFRVDFRVVIWGGGFGVCYYYSLFFAFGCDELCEVRVQFVFLVDASFFDVVLAFFFGDA